MDFLPVLTRNGCPHTIWLPLAIQAQTFPSQSPWRWGDRSLNVACLSCKRVYEYSESHCQWHRVDNTAQFQATMQKAVYLLVVPCGVERCGYLINILVITNQDEPPSEDSEIVTSLFAMGVSCGNEHRTTFELANKSPRILRKYEDFWQAN